MTRPNLFCLLQLVTLAPFTPIQVGTWWLLLAWNLCQHNKLDCNDFPCVQTKFQNLVWPLFDSFQSECPACVRTLAALSSLRDNDVSSRLKAYNSSLIQCRRLPEPVKLSTIWRQINKLWVTPLVIDSGAKKENCNPFVEKIRYKSKIFQESMEGSSVCVWKTLIPPQVSVSWTYIIVWCQ